MKANQANGKAIDQFARVEEGGIRLSWQRGDVGIPVDGNFREKRLEQVFLLLGKRWGGFDEVKLK